MMRVSPVTWSKVSVIEVNEAFASVVLQTLADSGLYERWEKGDVNPNGGGISLGHPLGATGARMTATLLSELERRDARTRAGDAVSVLRRQFRNLNHDQQDGAAGVALQERMQDLSVTKDVGSITPQVTDKAEAPSAATSRP